MKDVPGEVAFVTGGSSCIVLGIARSFANACMKLAMGYQTRKDHEEAMDYLKTSGDRVHAVKVAACDRAGIKEAVEEGLLVFGKVHIPVNNAGVMPLAPLCETRRSDEAAVERGRSRRAVDVPVLFS